VLCSNELTPLESNRVSYAIVTAGHATLYLNAANLDEVKQHLHFSGVECKPYADVLADITSYTSANNEKKILVDPLQCNVAVFLAIPPANRKEETSVVMAQKAIKSSVEIEGMRQAHIRDGAALVKFFSWLDNEMASGRADQWDEVQVADKQEEFRSKMADYVSLSFDTISSIGPNGSIIHYSPKRGDCPKLSTSAMYLNDSGAQYLDGTTDVTRTLHFGEPTAYERHCFTHVLKAHIALATAVFPNKIEGVKLDAITRAPLWQAGLDYRHGTGHGVGAYLNVHEKGVVSSVMRMLGGCVPVHHTFTDTILLSTAPVIPAKPEWTAHSRWNAPQQRARLLRGWPIRYPHRKPHGREEGLSYCRMLEGCELHPNLFCRCNIQAAHIKSPLNREFCEFETITMVPIQKKLIDFTRLTEREIKWLNAYHQEVHDKLKPLLQDDEDAYAFLVKETAPVHN